MTKIVIAFKYFALLYALVMNKYFDGQVETDEWKSELKTEDVSVFQPIKRSNSCVQIANVLLLNEI